MNDTSISNSRRALLVEDSLVNRKLLTRMLQREGFDVEVAADGKEGFEKFKQQSFDLVIMDIQMPVMDGLEATRQIRLYEKQSGTKTPVIAVTAGMDRESCMSAGMDAYLAKPVQIADFSKILQEFCPSKN